MHLTKDDIEWVGYHRFNKKHVKMCVVVPACLVGALLAGGLGLLYLFPDNSWAALLIGIPVMALAITWVAKYGKAQREATRELIKQCEADPHLIYAPDTETEVPCPGEKTVLP
jgi:hypothetical protein